MPAASGGRVDVDSAVQRSHDSFADSPRGGIEQYCGVLVVAAELNRIGALIAVFVRVRCDCCRNTQPARQVGE